MPEKHGELNPEKKARISPEETLLFMMILSFTGGYLNAYSYFTRGGAFVSLHTGNMVKIGLSAVTQDGAMFLACIVPILGGVLGAIIAQLLKVNFSKRSLLFWEKSALLAELAALLVVGLLPNTVPDNAVNFILSVVATFQLSNFRKYEGNVHNSTIQTGNLRTLGQYVADILIQRKMTAVKKAAKYFVLVFSFPFGALVGGFISMKVGISAIWVCCALMAVLTFVCLPRTEALPQQ